MGSIRTNRFFGGIGLAFDSVQFAMLFGENLYFVVDDSTRSRYETAGMQAFSYATKTKQVHVCRYFSVPDEVLAEPETLQQWAKEAIEIACKTSKSVSSIKNSKPARPPKNKFNIKLMCCPCHRKPKYFSSPTYI